MQMDTNMMDTLDGIPEDLDFESFDGKYSVH